MTTLSRRVVVDLELTGTDQENEDFLQALVSNIDSEVVDPFDVLDSYRVRVVNPDEERVLLTGGGPDGFRLWGPCPADVLTNLDADAIDHSFPGEPWWIVHVAPLPMGLI